MSKTVCNHLVEYANQDLRIITLIKWLIQKDIWVHLHIFLVLNECKYNKCKFCLTKCLQSNQIINLKYEESDAFIVMQ